MRDTPYARASDPTRWDTIRDVFRRAREARGMSLEAVAKLAGIRRGHLHQFESGEVREPKLAFLYAVGAVYGYALDDIADAMGLNRRPDPAGVTDDVRWRSAARTLAGLDAGYRSTVLDVVYATVAAYAKAPRAT